MRPLVMVIREPSPHDVIELFPAEAEEMIEAFLFQCPYAELRGIGTEPHRGRYMSPTLRRSGFAAYALNGAGRNAGSINLT